MPIRLIVLKARQVGSTTDFIALLYSFVSQGESQAAAVIADEKGKANDIFEMAKLFQETCPDWLRPNIKKSNERKLEFEGIHSHIAIDTAENKDAGRSATLRFVLLSEYAFYRKTNAEAIMLGISHSVPPLAKTMIIKETTANGFNHFKDEWDAAVRGENDYTPIFIPWYWDEGYVMPVTDGFVIGDPAFGDITADESILAEQMRVEGIDLIEQRLAWRRWDIRNNCKGDVDKFKQENPSTPEEAFIASGKCFFNQKNLVKQLKAAGEPLFKANIVKENFKFVLRKSPDGDFSFWKEPSIHDQYCIGGDACAGAENVTSDNTDWAGLVALDKGTNETVCTFHAKCDQDELAYRAMMLGNYLNQAVVAIENEKFGFAANEKLRTIYGNVYTQRTYNEIENREVTKIGWTTNAVTRPMMLGQLQEEIRENSTSLKDPKLIRECLTFIVNAESKKAEAESGMHDDLVMSRAIAGQIRREQPFKVTPERPTGREVHSTVKNAGLSFKKRH